LFWAFALLFAYTATNLALPDYQGRIIDQVLLLIRSLLFCYELLYGFLCWRV